jgi:putative transposase
MYVYRELRPEQKAEVLRYRALRGHPLHSPPHVQDCSGWFLITAATFEHRPHFERPEERKQLLNRLFHELAAAGVQFGGWVVLPNHYHLLLHCDPLARVAEPLRRSHARTARDINRDDGVQGRQVWYRYSDRQIRNAAHYFTTLNYIHYNPVKHRHVAHPLEWPAASTHWYREHRGDAWLDSLWAEYPLRSYGKGWDD